MTWKYTAPDISFVRRELQAPAAARFKRYLPSVPAASLGSPGRLTLRECTLELGHNLAKNFTPI